MADGDADSSTPISGDGLALEFIPPSDSGLPRQQMLYVNLEQTSWTLSSGARISGTLSAGDNPQVGWVALRNADSTRQIPGNQLPVFYAETEFNDTEKQEVYSSTVPSGSYISFAYPNDLAAFPPIVSMSPLLSLTDDRNLDFDFDRSYVHVQGTVSLSDGTPVGGAKVYAETNDQIWQRSNVVTTLSEGEQTGQFSLMLPLIAGSYVLWVDGGSSDEILLPKQKFENRLVLDDSAVTTPANGAPLSLVLDSALTSAALEESPCLVSGKVYGDAGNGSLMKIGQAKLKFTALFGEAIFEASAQSNEDGEYEAMLIPGHYYVTVLPPAELGYQAILNEARDCEQSGEWLPFNLGSQVTVSGLVTDSEGNPVVQATVLAEKLSEAESSYTYSKTVLTDENGEYHIAVDLGLHNFSVIPDTLMNTLARDSSQTEVVVAGAMTLPDIVLHDGQLFQGIVQDENGDPVPRVYIKVFRMRSLSDTSELRGEGTTGDDGSFSIIVP